MDDKFNQWCMKWYGMPYEEIHKDSQKFAMLLYNDQVLSDEIAELKAQIAALEGKE